MTGIEYRAGATIVSDVLDSLFGMLRDSVQEEWVGELVYGREILGVGYEFPNGDVIRLQARFFPAPDDDPSEFVGLTD